MKPLVYKGLRKNLNRSEWVSSDEIKQSYSQIRLLAVENDTYAWVPIEDGTLCRGSEAKLVFIPYWGYVFTPSEELLKARIRRNLCKESKVFYQRVRSYYETTMQGVPI